MAYSVNDKCIMCKHTDCVEVCPVDCFYEGENMLVINPDECIDCGVCEPECPEGAILSDMEEEGQKWIAFNDKWSRQWPVISCETSRRSILKAWLWKSNGLCTPCRS